MSIYKTALGKPVDMAALASKNEKTRAVGNMKVNARGDTIDSNGKVIVPITEKVNQAYAKTVGNKSAQPTKQPIPTPKPTIKPDELTDFEREIEGSLEEELEIERIKAREGKK